MAERAIQPSTYVAVCAVLIVLTVLTVSVSFVPLAGHWHLAMGLTIALAKASLVVLFFMHVLVGTRLTWLVIAVAVFWLGIMLVLVLGDYLTRDLIPFTPGH
jgi:cytochrome c oxidase subunit 4